MPPENSEIILDNTTEVLQDQPERPKIGLIDSLRGKVSMFLAACALAACAHKQSNPELSGKLYRPDIEEILAKDEENESPTPDSPDDESVGDEVEAPETLYKEIPIYFPTDSIVLPGAYQELKITSLKNDKERKRAIYTVGHALKKYPPEVLKKYLKRVYVFKNIEGIGGTVGDNEIFLAKKGDGVVYHEIAHLLAAEDWESDDLEKWKKVNPDNFKYMGKKGWQQEISTTDLYNQGFITFYARKSAGEDLSEISEMVLFSGDKEFWEIVDKYPRIRQKVDLAIAFYQKLHPQFTEEYFRNLPKMDDSKIPETEDEGPYKDMPSEYIEMVKERDALKRRHQAIRDWGWDQPMPIHPVHVRFGLGSNPQMNGVGGSLDVQKNYYLGSEEHGFRLMPGIHADFFADQSGVKNLDLNIPFVAAFGFNESDIPFRGDIFAIRGVYQKNRETNFEFIGAELEFFRLMYALRRERFSFILGANISTRLGKGSVDFNGQAENLPSGSTHMKAFVGAGWNGQGIADINLMISGSQTGISHRPSQDFREIYDVKQLHTRLDIQRIFGGPVGLFYRGMYSSGDRLVRKYEDITRTLENPTYSTHLAGVHINY